MMAGRLTQNCSYFNATIRHAQHVNLALAVDELTQQQIPGTVFASWTSGSFTGSLDVEWNCVGMAMVHEEDVVRLIAVGEYGQVLTGGGGKVLNSQIPAASDRAPLRNVSRISESVYAVGMGRHVYKRIGLDSWLDISPASPPAVGPGETTGFEAIDGFDSHEIYAVGWNGEIWMFDGQAWRNEASPTNAILVATCCGGDGLVYAAGRQGLLLRGRRDRWEVVDHRAIVDDIWGLCWYRDALYLSTMHAVYRLNGDRPARVDFGPDTPKTCFRIVAGHNVICSVGAKDVMLYDGNNWTRVD